MAQRELAPSDYMAMLRRRWILIVVLTVIGPPLAYTVSRFLPNKYHSQTLVLVQPPTVTVKIGDQPQQDTADLGQRLASMQQQILSRSRLEPIIRQYGLYAKDVDHVSMEDLVGRLQKSIDVTPVLPMAETKSTALPGFNVGVTMDDARTAQEVCAAVTSLFIEENLRQRQNTLENTTDFYKQQLADAKANLDAQDAKLAEFKSRYLGSLPDDEHTNLDLLNGLSTQLDAASQALGRAQQDKTFAESMLNQQLAAWQATQTGTNPETTDHQLAALQAQLATLRARYTDDYPDVIKTKADIAALQAKLAEVGTTPKPANDKGPKSSIEPPQIQQLRAQVRADDLAIAEKTKEQTRIQDQIRTYQARIQTSPVVEQQYKELTRGYQTAQDSYNELQKSLDSSKMSKDLGHRQQDEQFVVLDAANLPDKPSFPNRPMFALGGFAGGLGLGLGIAFFLELKDTSFKTERDVEFALQLPVLAMVPAIEPLSVSGDKKRLNQDPVNKGLELGARA